MTKIILEYKWKKLVAVVVFGSIYVLYLIYITFATETWGLLPAPLILLVYLRFVTKETMECMFLHRILGAMSNSIIKKALEEGGIHETIR